MNAPAALTPPPEAPPLRVGDLVDHHVCAAVLVDLDPTGHHLWAVIACAARPEAEGLVSRFSPAPDATVIGRDPRVALAGRALMAGAA
jgi:hypothetical protein